MTDNPEQTQAQAVKEAILYLFLTIGFVVLYKAALMKSGAHEITKFVLAADVVTFATHTVALIISIIETIHRRNR